ncbi:MAG TPA: hypothetical protein VHC90_02560 [Bryobacteraceae bacterium]|nr:hypothetical protein [Bryobacteraceae bacterium]
MPGYQHLACLCLLTTGLSGASAIAQDSDVGEIVTRSMSLLHSAWERVPDYAFVQRDEEIGSAGSTSRTQQVVMIDGSDYYMPIAVNDIPLPRGGTRH